MFFIAALASTLVLSIAITRIALVRHRDSERRSMRRHLSQVAGAMEESH